jgi:hypothetical protein
MVWKLTDKIISNTKNAIAMIITVVVIVLLCLLLLLFFSTYSAAPIYLKIYV